MGAVGLRWWQSSVLYVRASVLAGVPAARRVVMGACDPGPATTDSQRQWLLGAGAMWVRGGRAL